MDVCRVDLVVLTEADPFLAINVVRGEGLYARDEREADDYKLYVFRRAGDLAPLERERMALILGECLWLWASSQRGCVGPAILGGRDVGGDTGTSPRG